MRLAVNVLESEKEPRICLQHEQVLAIALHPGALEVGSRRSEMTKLTYGAGEMFLCRRHVEKWIRTDNLQYLSITISDGVLMAASDRTSGEVELPGVDNLVDARVAALVAVVNAERVAGFPNGQLFLDSVELALAMALVNGYAFQRSTARVHRGGLGPARLRKIKELVHEKMEEDLTLNELARSVGLSATHFSQMFRKSTGQSPHQYVLQHRVERAKEMLRAAEARVLDVAIACGFKTQQHFARVFRQVCGASPTEYRYEFLR